MLRGPSWGAMVATCAAELFLKSWDGMPLTSGVVAGRATCDFRLDVCAVYQHLCNNHPLSDASQYPLSIGLPAGHQMTTAGLAKRADDCLDVRKPAAQRTEVQAQKLKSLVDVVDIPERSVIGHVNWGTFTLSDVVSRTAGASPFENVGVR